MLSNDELACVYSALILQDDDIAVTPEKITTILKAAKVEVETYWPGLFARALEDVDVKALITNIGAGIGTAPAAAAAPVEAEEAKETKEEKKEESDDSGDDMGFGLFD